MPRTKKIVKPKLTERLVMNRSGEFAIHVSGDSHCGVKKDLTVRYSVRAECLPSLDKRGFLFDQLTVDNFFKSIGETILSCEELSMYCCEALMDLIHKENNKCEIKNMSLTLSPEPYAASMTYEWSEE